MEREELAAVVATWTDEQLLLRLQWLNANWQTDIDERGLETLAEMSVLQGALHDLIERVKAGAT